MSEINNRKKLALGVFISVGLLIFLVGVLTIGGQHKTFVKSIRLQVIFDDIQGLQTGNNVWLSGMKIGTVKQIAFYGNSQVEVVLNIELKAQPHIRKDSKARVSTDGLVGNKIIVITGGSDSLPVVSDNDRLESQHLAGTQELMSTLQASNSNLLEITTNLKVISARLKDGQGSLGQLLNDPVYANEIRGSLGHLQTASASGEKMVSDLQSFSARLRNSDGLVNQLITDTTIFHRLQVAVATLNQAAVSASDFSTSLQTAGKGLNDPNAPIGLLLHDQETGDNLQRTIKNLRVSSQELSDDLEAIQHSFLLRGFFKKRKKDAPQ